MADLDLLNPNSDLRQAYLHQLRQTIHAYNFPQIVLGEALQNAIDAIVETGGGPHKIQLELDFDNRTVSVSDDGIGFPNNPKLLFLGSGTKQGKTLFGLVGVGIKVVLFSSNRFSIKSRRGDNETFQFEVRDAYQFENDPPPDLSVPESFPEDPEPMEAVGTRIEYQFPEGTLEDPISHFLDELGAVCFPQGTDKGFGKTLEKGVQKGIFPNRFCGLMGSYLRRFSYSGDVLSLLGGKEELRETVLSLKVSCSDPISQFGETLGDLFDGVEAAECEIPLQYLLVEDSASWVPTQDMVGIFHTELGPGGSNLTRVFRGFNILLFAGDSEYEKLLTRKNGTLAEDNL